MSANLEESANLTEIENNTIKDTEAVSKGQERLSMRERIFLTFTDSSYSSTAYCLSFYFDALVALSMVSMCAETVVAWSRTAQQQRMWRILETVLTMNFVVDFVVKLTTARPLLKYVTRKPTFTIDLLGLLPFFTERLVEQFSADESSSIKALRVLRLLRFFRLSRIAYENFPDFRMFIQAVRRSKLAIAFLGMYVFGAGLFFASCIYFAETSECYLDGTVGVWYYLAKRDDGGLEPCSIQNMFGAWWFTLVTMTTVGYGDVNVISAWGKILTVLIMVTSLVFLALPSAIFAANLTEMYLERRLTRKHVITSEKKHGHEIEIEIEGVLAGVEAAGEQVQAALTTLSTHLAQLQHQKHQLHSLRNKTTLQRPVNAVKELIENALDAGADRIAVHLQVPVNSSSTETSAGLFSIQVTDNGSGISKADLALLCERHATSKLVSVSDLKSMGTFGFRGEALASCSQVGRVEVVTRSRESVDEEAVAWKASYVCGRMAGDAVAVAGNYGTIITVKDLFYGHRVRREALLNSSEEYQKIVQVMQAYALSQSGKCAFSLSKRRDRLEMQTAASDGVVGVVKRLWGEEVGGALMPFVVGRDDALGIEDGSGGWASRTTFHKLKSPQVIIFLNGRLIEHAVLRRSILQAFALHLPTSPPSYPFVYLNLKLKGCRVDVNIHPEKKQVVFVDEAEIVGRVVGAVEEGVLRRQYETQALKPIVVDGRSRASNDEGRRSAGDGRRSSNESCKENATGYSAAGCSASCNGLDGKRTKWLEGSAKWLEGSANHQQQQSVSVIATKISALYPSQRVLTDNRNHRIDTFLYHSSQPERPAGSGWSPLTTATTKKVGGGVASMREISSDQSDTSIVLESSQECEGCCEGKGSSESKETVKPWKENIKPSKLADSSIDSTVDIIPNTVESSPLVKPVNILSTLLSSANEQISRLLKSSLVVGLVDSQWALLQSSTNLLLCDLDRLNFDLFFSLLACADDPKVFEIGMRVKGDAFVEEDEAEVGAEAVDILRSKLEWLSASFGIKFTDYNEDLILKSLPSILPGQKCPSPRFIKTFLHRLCLCLCDESDETGRMVLKELAELYALIDFDGDDNWEEYVKHVVLPAYRDPRARFTLRNEFRNESLTSSLVVDPPVKIITNTETLYKSFERC